MQINSLSFWLFISIVFLIDCYLRKTKVRNFWLLVVSFFFYISWQPIYVVLLLFTITSTFFASLLIEQYRKHDLLILTCSIGLNVLILGIFKYYAFITENIEGPVSNFGFSLSLPEWKLLLPLGISFYTFQAIGYNIDVYRDRKHIEKNFINYALFVSFFPKIVSGPIEKSFNFLPQLKISNNTNSTFFFEGIRYIIYGCFMKFVLADQLGLYVDAVYNNLINHNGLSILIASIFYSFQIYGDFAGYSLIAIGCARLFGITLQVNFIRPYLAINIHDFWRRWHISLTSWFTNYIYFPLGGSRVVLSRHLLNILIVFLISGLWHGANWTFVLWGAVHGIAQIIYILYQRTPTKCRVNKIIGQLITFIFVTFAWVLFRSKSLEDSIYAYSSIFNSFDKPFIHINSMFYGLIGLCIVLFKEYIEEYYPTKMQSWPTVVKDSFYVVLVIIILSTGVLDGGQFIYFQF